LAPHGIPVDLLDRLLIIRTLPYSLDEIKIIVGIRAKTESIKVSEESVQKLAEIGSRTSLRYAIQLLTPANILTRMNGGDEILVVDIEEVERLFFDAKTSAKILQEHAENYIS
jgi:RuvB-like protein 1 (pontin 52)